jgi:hypothetical protein
MMLASQLGCEAAVSRILVGYDGTASGRRALDRAVEEACRAACDRHAVARQGFDGRIRTEVDSLQETVAKTIATDEPSLVVDAAAAGSEGLALIAGPDEAEVVAVGDRQAARAG